MWHWVHLCCYCGATNRKLHSGRAPSCVCGAPAVGAGTEETAPGMLVPRHLKRSGLRAARARGDTWNKEAAVAPSPGRGPDFLPFCWRIMLLHLGCNNLHSVKYQITSSFFKSYIPGKFITTTLQKIWLGNAMLFDKIKLRLKTKSKQNFWNAINQPY